MVIQNPRSLVDRLRLAKHVVVLTGAGVSAESGIPTFRDKQTGIWEQFSAEEFATPEAYQRNPSMVWGWYEWPKLYCRLLPPVMDRYVRAARCLFSYRHGASYFTPLLDRNCRFELSFFPRTQSQCPRST
jgi:hypothetical protein